ncbi:MAG: hypothetical protein N2385_14575, partial [Chloroflexus sp.]|nr:hypothetical protein [Chloroflexus sp.]
MQILRRMEWVVQKGNWFYDNNARLFIEYHNLWFFGILVGILEKGLEGEVAADEGKTLTQLNRALDHYI